MSFETVPAVPEVQDRSWASVLFWPALVTLLAFHVFANLAWQRLDNRPVRTDEEVHMIAARQYHQAFTSPQYDSLLKRIIATSKVVPGNPMHPPVLHISGAIMVMLFGYSTDIIAMTCTVYFLLMLLGCYALLRNFLDPWQALFCVLIASLTPITFGASRFFMTDFASAALVIWALHALVKSNYFQNMYWVFIFAVLNGLNILTRTNNFLLYLVPCLFLVALGLFYAWRGTLGLERWAALRRWLFNCIMTAVVTVGIFGPWYFHHLDALYNFWIYDHLGGRGGPFASSNTPPATPMESLTAVASLGAVEEGSAPPASASHSAAVALAAAPNPLSLVAPVIQSLHAQASSRFENLLRPRVLWRRYPVHLVNNGMFLPLFVLSVIGMLCVPLLSRYRNTATLTMLLCVFGSWALLTIVFKYDNPRYAIPVVPVLSLFAGMAVLALPGAAMRRGFGALLAVFLLFQFLHISFFKLPGPERLELPLPIEPANSRFMDPGAVIFKDELVISNAFSPMGRPMKENFMDRIFAAMVKAELQQPYVSGDYANFQRLNVRGLELDQRHYWPAPNPYAQSKLPGGEVPRRRFRSFGLAWEPSQLVHLLDTTDYVVYSLDKHQTALEPEWQQFLQDRNFTLIERFDFPGYGLVPPRLYGVMMRLPEGELFGVQSTADIDAFQLYDLHAFLQSAGFEDLPLGLQEYARQRFERLVAPYRPFQMNESVALVTMSVGKTEPGWMEMTFLFKVLAPFRENYRVFFHAAPLDPALLSPAHREQGYQDWNFEPVPPTLEWKPDSYVLLKRRFQVVPAPYQFSVGFFRPPNRLLGIPAQAQVDLSPLADE